MCLQIDLEGDWRLSPCRLPKNCVVIDVVTIPENDQGTAPRLVSTKDLVRVYETEVTMFDLNSVPMELERQERQRHPQKLGVAKA